VWSKGVKGIYINRHTYIYRIYTCVYVYITPRLREKRPEFTSPPKS
jgi:hypothetical protein